MPKASVKPSTQPTHFVVSGIWKFSITVPIDDLVQVATELLEEHPHAYLGLSVRVCSKDQVGICYTFNLKGTTSWGQHLFHKEFFDYMRDKFYKRFGIKFAGWDFSEEVWVVK